MTFYLTNKVKKELSLKGTLPKGETKEAWHVTVEEYEGGEQVYVFTHVLTAYTIILFNPDLYHGIMETFVNALKKSLEFEGFKESVVSAYLEELKTKDFMKTADRQVIAQTTDRKHMHQIFYEYHPKDTPYGCILNYKINHSLYKDFYPIQAMFDYMKKYEETPLNSELYTLRVAIHLDNKTISRTLSVPSNRSLYGFHIVLQKAFGWHNMHLFEFMSDDVKTRFAMPDPEFDSKDDVSVYHHTVETLFQKSMNWTYIYDFGDYWQHEITLLKTSVEEGLSTPVCLAYSGDNLVEDSGGISGYESLMAILEDKTDPEYEDAYAYYKKMHKPFNFFMLNKALMHNTPYVVDHSPLSELYNSISESFFSGGFEDE